LMCVGGPPNPMQPIRPHSRTTVSKPASAGAGAPSARGCDVTYGVLPGSSDFARLGWPARSRWSGP
jgi:hypothetical protein